MARNVTELKQWVNDAEENTQISRRASEKARDYYDGKQWSDDEIAKLKKRKQPPITTNIIVGKVDTFKGIEIQQRNKPMGLPRNIDHDEQAAEASTDGLRYVVDANKYQSKRSKVWENMTIEGFGGIELTIEFKNDEPVIKMDYVPWNRLGYDPASMLADFSDAKYKYQILWMDLDDAKVKFPGHDEDLENALTESRDDGDSYGDKPRGWQDKNRKRLKIAKMYYLESAVWRFATFTEGVILEEGEVPFIDEEGVNFCPLSMTSAYVDRDNKRYGPTFNWISPQEMINKFRSKATHSINVNRLRISPSAETITKKETIRQEYAKPDGIIVADRDDIEDLPNTGLTTGSLAMLGEVKQELNEMGANRSLQGNESRDLSGKAERLRQNAGLLTIAGLLDNLRDFDLEIYEHIWWMIRQFWTEEKWIRVTDDENNVDFVGLNRPKTFRDQIIEEFGEVPPQEENNPNLDKPIKDENGQIILLNKPADIGLDIILEQSPNVANLQEEQFEELVKFSSVLPPEMLAVPLLKSSQIRGKDSIIDAIEGNDVDPKVAQQQQEDAEMAKEIQIRAAVSEIENTDADTLKKVSETSLNEVKAIETETEATKNVVEMQQR